MESTLSKLKQEIKSLKDTFNQENGLFKISGNIDELSCDFSASEQQNIAFTVYFTDNYPLKPPVWFADTDNESIIDLLKSINESKGKLTSQVKYLITNLCDMFSCSLSEDIQKFQQIPDSDNEENDSEEEVDCEEDPFDGGSRALVPVNEFDLIHEENEMLKKADRKLLEDKMRGSASGNSFGIDRLKKELMIIWKSESFKMKQYTLELVNDSVYEWHVRLLLPAIASDSSLYQDLLKLKEHTGKEGILLHFMFRDDYPFVPPFVRVVEPVIDEGHVYEGAMCLELLVKQGWNPAISIEVVIQQIAASLTTGHGRVNFFQLNREYTLERAQQAMEALNLMPDTHRWTSRKEDG